MPKRKFTTKNKFSNPVPAALRVVAFLPAIVSILALVVFIILSFVASDSVGGYMFLALPLMLPAVLPGVIMSVLAILILNTIGARNLRLAGLSVSILVVWFFLGAAYLYHSSY